MQLQFTPDDGLGGARMECCLLEKNRVVSHAKGERNFHIFYELCAGWSQVIYMQIKINFTIRYNNILNN